MAVSPSRTIVAQESPIRPLTGTPARIVAEAQGEVWGGIAGTAAIAEHAETFETVDRQGDLMMHSMMRLLAQALDSAKHERASQTVALLHDAIACGIRVVELDDHEDDHVREMKGHAAGTDRHLRQTSALHGALLGQKEAVCGRSRPDLDGVVFRTCQRPAGHAALGLVCIFEAVPTAPANLP